MGGHANQPNGRIYQIGVTRDGDGHITGFTGSATVYPTANATIGQNNDGGVVFGPENMLFVTRFPNNQLEQSKPGSTDPDKVTDLNLIGIDSSVGSIGFVPSGFPGAGSMKIVSASGEWYHCDFVPDGNGTFEVITAFQRATLADTPEGIVFVPPGSPVFPANSVLINNWSSGKIVTAPLDANGDPIVANTQDVVVGFGASEGPFIDPLTGDLLFWSTNNGGVIFRVSGFEVPPTPTPTPSPSCTPNPWIVMEDYPFAVDSSALATDGTYAYAFGGSSSTGGQHAEANRYDPFTNTWMAIASLTTGQDFYFHGEYGGNGKIYVIGSGFSQRATRIYDIGTNTWSAGTLVPVGIFGYGHAYADGKIYVIGGFVDGNYSSTIYAYDVASDTWSAPLAPLPQGEAQMACGVINNKI